MALAIRTKSRKRPATLLHSHQGHHGFSRASHRRRMEPEGGALPVARPNLRPLPRGEPRTRTREVLSAMSAAASTILGAPAQAKKATRAGGNLKGLFPYLRRYTPAIISGLLMVVFMALVGNIIPLATGIMTDVLAGDPHPFQHSVTEGVPGSQSQLSTSALARHMPYYAPHSRQSLLIYCVLIVALIALKGVLSFGARWVLIGVSRDIEYDIRNDLLDRLLVLEPEFYVRNRTGELMSRATNDLNAVRMVLGPGIMYTATTIATMLLAVTVMVMLSGSLTLWVLLPVPVVALVVRHFGKVIHELYERIQAALATLTARVQENLAGIRVVRAYAQEQSEIRGFDEPNREYVARNVKLIRTWSLFMPSLQALIGVTFLIVLWAGGYLLLRGRLSLGALIAFNAYLTQLVWPMIALGWVTNIFQRGAASMRRLDYILNAKPQIDDRFATIPAGQTPCGEIEFRNLTFTYPTTLSGNGADRGASNNGAGGGHPVLRDINLKIPAGSTLAVIGPTGSGKTTLAALVARLWEAPENQVLIDGRPIREWPLESLRRNIGFV